MLRRFVSALTTQTRGLKSSLTVTWVRPEKIASTHPIKSGDLEPVKYPARDAAAHAFDRPDLVKDIDDQFKSLFSVGFQGSLANRLLVKKAYVDRVRRHKYDTRSMEAKIALMTARIRMLQYHLEKMPRDGRGKARCKELIDKRKQCLKRLRCWDYKRYEWVLEQLNIEYKPAPSDQNRVTRKQSITKLVQLQMSDIRQKKMEEYKVRLLAERDNLLKIYAENPLPPLKDDKIELVKEEKSN